MILLVTPIARRGECAAALRETTGDEIVIAANLLEATTLLRTESCRAAVFDHHLIEREPQELDTAFSHLGTAVPIVVNLALTGLNRLAREVEAALHRQAREQAAARQSAAATLHTEVNGTLTALLLDFEAALQFNDLPPEAASRLRSAHTLAEKLRSQLSSAV
jgi:hypothetical protein